jgi:hypothetical protein
VSEAQLKQSFLPAEMMAGHPGELLGKGVSRVPSRVLLVAG